MSAKSTNESTTIRVSRRTKERLENLGFVRKHTFDEILLELADFYERSTDKEVPGNARKARRQ
jgi:hypothetical protein